MTLNEAVVEIQQRVGVDLDVGFNLQNPDLVTKQLMKAARIVSRDTYFLFTMHSALTLTTCTDGSSAGAEIDLLATATSVNAIFHCYGIHINGSWLQATQFEPFITNFNNYYTDTANANPGYYVPLTPSSVRLYPPPNATAVAASDNFAIGFYLHTKYVWDTNQGSELLGPEEFHDLIVERCLLDVTEGFVGGDDALKRRAITQAKYEAKAGAYKAFNESRAHKIGRKAGAGKTIRSFPVVSGGFV